MTKHSIKIIRPPAACLRRSAFTLVELLVVIGIIALLIGILLPTLARARQIAQRTACAAKLQQIMVAANAHVVEHKGYFPLVGQLVGDDGQMGPASLDDTYTSRYTFFGDFDLTQNSDYRLLAPITYALGTEMGLTKNLGTSADPVDPPQIARNFLCPSQANDVGELHQSCWLYAGYFGSYYGGCTAYLSYGFNEAVLGYNDTYARLRGCAARIRQPSKTCFAFDSLGGSTKTRLSGTWKSFNDPGGPPQPWPSITLWNNTANAPITMSDAITKRTVNGHILAGDVDNFDQIRHHGKMNIAFCDGHVETRDIPVFTLNPITDVPVFKNDPNAVGLMNVYLLAP